MSIRVGSAPPQSARPPARDAAADQAVLDAILAALDAGDRQGAAALSEQALRSGLGRQALLSLMAATLESRGRAAEAIPHLKRALELAPDDIPAMAALARCLLAANQAGEALALLKTVIRLDPSHADARAHKGLALERLGWIVQAEPSYARALELDPGNLTAQAGMASVCSHYGQHQAARAHAQAVLEASPDNLCAGMAMAVADIADGAPAAAEARIRSLIAVHGPTPALTGRLGDALHAQGKAQEAFDAYSRAGEAVRGLLDDQYDRDNVLDAAERTANLLERLPMGDWPRGRPQRPEPAGVETHVFLTGFARSGTSLLGLVLEGHDQVELLQEQEPLVDALRLYDGPEGLKRLLAASEADLAPLRSAYWRHARRGGAKLDRPVFVDKHPLNSLHLPVIARLFPEARVLFMRRDPRDVVLSCFRRQFLVNRYTYQLLTAEGSARLYAAAMRIAHSMEALASLETLAVAHEDLVRDFDGETRAVCAFLGVPWSEALRSFSDRVRTRGVATPSAAQLSRGLNRDGMGQWRRYARQLEPLAPYVQPWVERFGYDEGPRSLQLGAA